MRQATFSLTELYHPIRDDLARVESIFDRELATDLPFLADLCDTVRSYRGKMLRPALLLLTGKALGRLTPDHHTLAAVVEMVHMATLVHDDVLDEADQRRGRPTVGAISGNTAAVLLGDFLISHAFHLCSGLDSQYAARLIGATTNTVCEGELLQNEHRGDAQVTEAIYFDIIRRKTGALTAAACELGAYFAGADGKTIDALRAYGMSAGVAFQIVDDVLDITGDLRQVGKTLGRDLAMGKLTLPTIHALSANDAGLDSAIRDALSGTALIDAQRLRERLTATGSLDYALESAVENVNDALRRLEVLPPSDARSSLTSMAEFIIQRSF